MQAVTNGLKPYKPKENHPWRRYKDKANLNTENKVVEVKPSLKLFISNLALNWDTYQVDADEDLLLNDYQKVRNLPEAKVAEWLINFLRRNWVTRSRDVMIDP